MKYKEHDIEMTHKLYRLVEENNEDRVFKHWHASSLADCPRAHYFKRKGVKSIQIPGAGKMFRWATGDMTEDNLRQYLEKLHPSFTSNDRMTSDKFDLTGEYDGYDPEEQTLHEVKSVHPYAMKYRKVDDDRIHVKEEQPYLNHRIQNHAYVLLLDDVLDQKVKKITYHYLALDGRYARYTEDVNAKVMGEVKRRLELLNTHWEEDKIPPCICSHVDNPLYATTMQYCDYRTIKPNKERADENCCDINLLEGVNNE